MADAGLSRRSGRRITFTVAAGLGAAGAFGGLIGIGLVISPWARAGLIDSQTLSFDAYLKLIEDLFLHKERLDPATLSRPDSRPTVREKVSILGNLLKDFDFTQDPIPPLILDPNP